MATSHSRVWKASSAPEPSAIHVALLCTRPCRMIPSTNTSSSSSSMAMVPTPMTMVRLAIRREGRDSFGLPLLLARHGLQEGMSRMMAAVHIAPVVTAMRRRMLNPCCPFSMLWLIMSWYLRRHWSQRSSMCTVGRGESSWRRRKRERQ